MKLFQITYVHNLTEHWDNKTKNNFTFALSVITEEEWLQAFIPF